MLEVHDQGEVIAVRMARAVLGRPLYFCYAFLVNGLLIDTGLSHVCGAFQRFLRKYHVEQVVITHHHEDHSGNAWVANALGFLPYAHPRCVEILATGFPLQLYRHLIWGPVRPARCQPIPAKIQAGRYSFQVLHAPGHSEDMVVLLEQERGWLFSSDLFLSRRLLYLQPEEDIYQLMASLDHVLRYGFTTVFCSHRGRLDQGKEALQAKLDHLRELEAAVKDLRARGWDEEAITRRLLGREGWMTWLTGGHFSKRNLIRAFLRSTR
ncbi:MAG: MBL fold metallo-hydrolase [Armatimonadota bacterium]|nr:MBL fold metallo-hydrolase [Armatimonadota bacterium]MDR5702937.1 MBL fold metallo-hydrolase [Armatimonadota bacterium]MDR7433872.1 MBL fold metallo-hydrolase [Armatimonadota bacterium]